MTEYQRILYQNLLYYIFIEMAQHYKQIEKEFYVHLEFCEYHNPNICSRCAEIYTYYKKHYKINTFSDIFKRLSIKQKFNKLLCTDRDYFLKAFEPLLKKELERYTYNKYIEKADLKQEGYILLIKLFETSKYRTINASKFVSYVKKTFPKLLLQKYLFLKKKNSIYCEVGSFLKDQSINDYTSQHYSSFTLDDLLCIAENILTETAYLIFVLHYKYKYKITDIATLMSVNKNYVINSLYYSRQQLKEYLNITNNENGKSK